MEIFFFQKIQSNFLLVLVLWSSAVSAFVLLDPITGRIRFISNSRPTTTPSIPSSTGQTPSTSTTSNLTTSDLQLQSPLAKDENVPLDQIDVEVETSTVKTPNAEDYEELPRFSPLRFIHTVWKFQDVSVIWILREINLLRGRRNSKIDIFAILGVLTFVTLVHSSLQIGQKFIKIKILSNGSHGMAVSDFLKPSQNDFT